MDNMMMETEDHGDVFADNYSNFLKSIGVDDSSFSIPYQEQISEYRYTEDGKEVVNYMEIDESEIFDEIKCPVCLGSIEKTSTVMACLHRFCSECLHRCLRMEIGPNKLHECPACRVKIASKRSSKPDPLFDSILEMFNDTPRVEVAPSPRLSKSAMKAANDIDMSAFRKKHLENIAKFKEKQKTMGVTKRLSSLRTPSANSSPRELSATTPTPTSTNAATPNAQGASIQSAALRPLQSSNVNRNMISFAVFPWPEVLHVDLYPTHSFTMFSRPYLTTSPYMTIRELKEMVCSWKPRVVVNSTGRVDSTFYFEANHLQCALISDKIRILSDEMTLLTLCSVLWNRVSPLVLYMRINPHFCLAMANPPREQLLEAQRTSEQLLQQQMHQQHTHQSQSQPQQQQHHHHQQQQQFNHQLHNQSNQSNVVNSAHLQQNTQQSQKHNPPQQQQPQLQQHQQMQHLQHQQQHLHQSQQQQQLQQQLQYQQQFEQHFQNLNQQLAAVHYPQFPMDMTTMAQQLSRGQNGAVNNMNPFNTGNVNVNVNGDDLRHLYAFGDPNLYAGLMMQALNREVPVDRQA